MPDAIFTDPRMAGVYDACNPPDRSTEFYLELAGDEPLKVLDMGCGTGRLACDLAARGHHVTGADPATGMLDIARNRPDGDAVTWILSDAASLSLEDRFDLIIMTGHVFQVFLSDEAIHAALANLRAHLSPATGDRQAGRLAFETRNPAVEEWREWQADASRETVQVDGMGEVEVCWDVTNVDNAYLTFDTRYRFPNGDRAAASSTLRFMGQDELAGHLRAAGFAEFTWLGDWDRAPVGPTAPEIIVVAR